jgi:chromosomal replication initiation ATPase DnaA
VPSQLRLDLERRPDYARAAFVISASTAQAVQALDGWPDWRGGALALVGPPGCGKTHLASVWAERMGAVTCPGQEREPALTPRPMVVEEAGRSLSEESLFHLLNLASRPGGGLLLTSRLAPNQWPVRLPDLRSRLNALPVAELEEPDDAVLDAMLRKFFRERNIRPSEELLAYLVRRIERSAQSAADVVRRLDEAAHASHRGVSRSLARLVLGEEPADTAAS